MSEATEVPSTKAKANPPPTHAEMFFRYVGALAQTAGVQAFTLAIAVPKEDGTSAVMSMSAGSPTATAEWKEEIVKLLADSASKACQSILETPKAAEGEAAEGEASDEVTG